MTERINIQEYLDMIKRRKWLIIVILLVSLALGAFKTYQNYVSFVPRYTSTVVVKIDSMKVQKEEAAKEKEKNKDKDNRDSDSDDSESSEEDVINYFNYSIIAQDESISNRYYSYMDNEVIKSKVAQVSGIRNRQIQRISSSQDETRPEVIYITVTALDADSAKMAAEAVPEVFNTELLKEIGIDCVSTVYEATEATPTTRGKDRSIVQCGMAGLVIAIFLMLLLECLNTKIVTPDDVEKYWDLPLLGVVPMYDKKSRKKKK